MRHTTLTIAAIVLAAIVLLSGYGGWLPPSRFGALPAALVLAYQPLVAVASVLSLVGLLFGRRRPALILLAAVLATWPAISANFPVHPGRPSAPSGDTFTVMSYNVAAFPDEPGGELHTNMRLILDSGADFVVLLQPTTRGLGYDERATIEPWLSTLDSIYPYRTRSRYDGVELLSKHPFRAVPLSLPGHSYRHYPYVLKSTARYAFDVRLPGGRQLRLIGAYMTSFQLDEDERRVMDTTRYSLEGFSRLWGKLGTVFVARERSAGLLRDSIDAGPDNVVVCTDLNDVPLSYAYRTLAGRDLRDAFAELHTGPLNTFRAHNMLFHIDHILYRGSLRAVGYHCARAGNSDHYPVMATFEWR